MTDPVVYRSTDPDVLASWAAACEALAEYVRQTQAVLDEAGLAGRPVFRHTGGRNYGQVGGIGCEDGIWSCKECMAYLHAHPHLAGAAASVGIEHGQSTGQMVSWYLTRYHERGHQEAPRD